MTQGARTRVVIGSAVQHRTQTPRTLQQAFGPHATRNGLESTSDRVDRLIGRFCAVIFCAVMGALIASAWIK